VNAAELIVFNLQREDDVVVEAEPDVSGATSRVKVANYLDIRVAHHLAMSTRELERKHLHTKRSLFVISVNKTVTVISENISKTYTRNIQETTRLRSMLI